MPGTRLAPRIIVTAILAVLAASVSAQPAGTPPPAMLQSQTPAAPGAAQVSGVVKSASDGAPIGRARVSATTDAVPEPRVTLSAADGKYALSDLPPGSYTVSVTRTGYAPQVYSKGRTLTTTPIAVAAGQQVPNLDFALVPSGSIAGRVFDEDGAPFAGAIVEALVTRSDNGADALVAVAASRTDDRGEFRLFGLAPGNYYVTAADPAFRAVSTPKGVLHYSPTYFPGVPFPDQARTVVVTGAGDAPRAEFRLKLVPPANVSGQLQASDGHQLFSAAIIMSPLGGEGIAIAPPRNPKLLPDGNFTFDGVAPGHYEIRARGQTDAVGAVLFAVFSLQILGADVEGIQMMLRPGAVLDGRLIVEGRRGARPPALVSLRARAPFIDGTSFGDALTGTVQADGSFALRGLMKGSHQFALDGLPPPWVVKSVLFHGADITDQRFDVVEREQFRDVRVTITDAASEVTGIVENARRLPVANTGVLVFPRVPVFWMRTNRRMRIAYTDREGRFTIPGLPAGDYLAVASLAVDESDLGRRDRLTAWEGLATPFSLASDDGRATVRLAIVAPPPGPAPNVR